jgi:hypothetical protein
MTSVLVRDTERRRPREDKAEMIVMWPQAKDTWSHQDLDGAGRGLLWSPATPSLWTSGLRAVEV